MKVPHLFIVVMFIATKLQQLHKLIAILIIPTTELTSINKKLDGGDKSTWINFSNDGYFAPESSIESMKPGDITSQWKVIPEENRIEFEQFFKEIIKLSKNHKLTVENINDTVSDSIYVMF